MNMLKHSFIKFYFLLFLSLVLVVSVTSEADALSFLEMHQNGVGGVEGLDVASSVFVSPDGNNVYAVSYRDDAIVVFSRNTVNGALTVVEVLQDGVGGVQGIRTAQSVFVSPDNNHVYVASDENAIAVFSRNTVNGALTFVQVLRDGVGGVDGLAAAASVFVSPDGNHVYAAGAFDDAIAVFSRDIVTGALAFVQVLRDGVGGVEGLGGAVSVFVSPDGNHVYAAALYEDSIAVFSRNTVTGTLTFIEVLRDGVGGVDGLYGATSVFVSPDGNHVYAAGSSDDAIAVFSRDTVTGTLTFVEVLRDGMGDVDGLYGATSVFVSPDGSCVYAAGYDDNAIAVFSRDTVAGTLTFIEVLRDGVGGVDGLLGVNSVAVSPDSKNVYTAASRDDAVAVFAINAVAIPTLSEWGILIFMIITMGTGLIIIKKEGGIKQKYADG